MNWHSFGEYLIDGLWRATWQGSIALVIALAITTYIVRLRPSVRCWIWRLAFLKLLLAFCFASALEIPLLPPDQSDAAATIIINKELQRATPDAGDAIDPVEVVAGSTPQPHVASRGFEANSFASTGVAVLTIAWMLGFVYQCALVALSWRNSRRITTSAVPLADATIIALLHEVAESVGLKRSPRLGHSEAANSPMIVAGWRSTIVIPQSVVGSCHAAELRLILRHELAHLRHHHHWWNLLGAVARCVFFFNPLIWIALSRWRLDQESTCDALAIGTDDDAAVDYARLLIRFSTAHRLGASAPMAFTFAQFTHLKRRIEMIDRLSQPSRRLAWLAPCVIASGLVCVVPISITRAEPKKDAATPQSPPLATAKSGTYTLEVTDITRVQFGRHRPVFAGSPRLQKQQSQALGNGSRGFRGGGTASGTINPPNTAIAVRVKHRKGPVLVTLDGEAIAEDEEGNEYRTSNWAGPRRISFPDFEATHPDAAGLYFNLPNPPEFLTRIDGTLQITPAKLYDAEFPLGKLTANSAPTAGAHRITISNFARRDKLIELGVHIPFPQELASPGRRLSRQERWNWSDARRMFAANVTVMLIDASGKGHLPTAESGGHRLDGPSGPVQGGNAGVGGGAGGARFGSGGFSQPLPSAQATGNGVSRQCQFELPADDVAQALIRVTVKQPLPGSVAVPFTLRDVPVARNLKKSGE